MNKKKITMIIVAAIVGISIAFFGGTVYEKDKLSSQGLLRSGINEKAGQDGQRRNPGQEGQGKSFAGNRGGGPNGGGGFVSGEMISKDEKSMTVKMNDGGSKIVFFSDSTIVGKSVQGNVSDLATGNQVMISGKANADGTVTAENIQIRPDQPINQSER